jgi:nicotinate-nucleotide adenylyltransferase
MQEEHEVKTISHDLLNDYRSHKNVIICDDAPVMKVSSSFIRDAIKNGKDVRYLLTEPVYKYIDEMNFYK